MRYILIISWVLLSGWIFAQGSTCLEENGVSFSGRVESSTEEQLVLKVESVRDLEVGHYGQIMQRKSMGLNNSTISWGKKIAEGKILKVSNNRVTIGQLKRESQDGMLFILDHLLDVKIDEQLEVNVMVENPCLDTVSIYPGYALGCECAGVKRGEWRYFTTDDSLQRVEHYDLAGELSGPYCQYAHGKLKLAGEYKVYKRVGSWTNYYPNGSIFQQLHYDSLGRLEGAQREFDERGKLRIAIDQISAYPNPRFHYTAVDQNGVLRFSCYFSEEFALRDSLELFDEKAMRTRSLHIQGNVLCDSRYHEDGRLRAVECYDMTDSEIHWRKSDEFGMPQVDGEPSYSGLKTGSWTTYRPGGELSWQGTYQSDMPHGKWETYQNGVLVRVENYEIGERSGEWVNYATNGTVEMKCNYLAGKLNGVYLEYYPSGQLKKRSNYAFDALVTSYETYFENGQLMEQGTYGQYANAGKREGLWLSYYENGGRKEQGNYTNDQKTGTWIYWDENGKKRKEKFK